MSELFVNCMFFCGQSSLHFFQATTGRKTINQQLPPKARARKRHLSLLHYTACCFILLLAYSSVEMCAQEKVTESGQQDAVAGEKKDDQAKSGDGEKIAGTEKMESEKSAGDDEGTEKDDKVENDGRSDTTLDLSPVPKKRIPAVTPTTPKNTKAAAKKKPAAKEKAKMVMKAKDVKKVAKGPKKQKKTGKAW